MEDKKLLIVGIDPGTTTAYAVLDIEGNLLHLYSSKQLDLNSLISETIKLGKVVLVGTDKVKVPSLIEAFATKLGAKTISPDEDLKVEEKRRMTSNHNFANEHQQDALASALFVCKQIKPLLDKIDIFIEKGRKHHIKDSIRELVITKKISIKGAVGLIEKKDEESQIMEKVVVERKLNERDFLKLYDKLKRYENELRLVRNHNSSLKRQISNLVKQTNPEKPEYNAKITDFRHKRMRFLEKYVKSKENEIQHLKSATKKLTHIISNIGSFYILKKLDNLGISEFNHKNKILNIQRNDILLVDNPNIVGNGLVDLLKSKVFVIVHRKPVSGKIGGSLPFIFINARNLRIEEDGYFGFVEKKHFEMEKNKINWVKKIVEDYKREKEQLA